MMRRWLAFVLFLQTPIVLAAAPEWIVETGDFHPHTGAVQRLSADALELRNSDGAVESVSVRDVLRLRLQQPMDQPAEDLSADVDLAVKQTLKVNGTVMTVASTDANNTQLTTPDGKHQLWPTSVVRQMIQANLARNHRGTLALELSSGDRFAGKPVGIDGASLTWHNDVLGDLHLSTERLLRLVRLPTKSILAPATPAEDTATLINGDVVHGIMSNLSGSALVMQAAGGSATQIALDSIQRVDFAQTAQPVAPPDHGFRLELNDGSSITVQSLGLDGDQWSAKRLDGADSRLPLTAVREVEQLGGPVIWLSDLSPIESLSRSYFGRSWPAQVNHAVDGGPLRFESREFRHGIGVHSYSKLTFDLPAGVDQLHVNYCIDGEAPYADVNVRIWLDDKVVLDSPHVRAGTLAAAPTIPLAGAKHVSLEVDFGDNQDVQDRLNWIEPALLRAASK